MLLSNTHASLVQRVRSEDNKMFLWPVPLTAVVPRKDGFVAGDIWQCLGTFLDIFGFHNWEGGVLLASNG